MVSNGAHTIVLFFSHSIKIRQHSQENITDCMKQLAVITHSNFRVNLNNHFRAHFFFVKRRHVHNTNACYNTKWKFIITYYRSSFILCFKKKCNFPRRCHPAKIRTIFAVNLVRIEVTSPYSNKTRSINFKVIKITK